MNKQNKPTILVVDDDKRVLKSFKMWLSNEGFNALAAENGGDAVKLISDNPVDVALVDFRISREDGLMVTKSLKEIDEDLKVVMLTGFPSYETAVKAMKIGVYDYLSKGASNEKILAVLKKAVTERNREVAVKQQDTSSDKRIKMILFCNHSLIKERLENFSLNSSDFKLVKSFPLVNDLKIKNVSRDIHIALVCAGCNFKDFADAFTIFPQLYRVFPGVKTLLINESFTDREKVELLRLGIRGFCSTDSGCDTLEKAIMHVAKGDLWISRRVTQMSLDDMIHYGAVTSAQTPAVSHAKSIPTNVIKGKDAFGLTPKEKEILKKITQGLKNKEISQKLSISEATVKTHINRILKKMGVDSRTKAILVAMERKIV
jgi:DNA-binding NarL/FixJ family response regulator